MISLFAAAETYFFDFQFSSDETDVVSVEIDAKGKGLKDFENELTSDFGDKIGTGTFLEVTRFSSGNDGNVAVKFIAKKRLFSHWQPLTDGTKNPLFKSTAVDTELKLKYDLWQTLGTVPGKDPMRARVRKIN